MGIRVMAGAASTEEGTTRDGGGDGGGGIGPPFLPPRSLRARGAAAGPSRVPPSRPSLPPPVGSAVRLSRPAEAVEPAGAVVCGSWRGRGRLLS